MSLAFRLAKRELRGGLKGFRVFLICLCLGVAALAAITTLRDAIQNALSDQGAVLLGGDAELRFTYRRASAEELAFMAQRAEAVSEILDFRSMAVFGEDQGLTQVKAVDAHYPLYGAPELSPAITLQEALADHGAVMDGVLIARLGLKIGDRFKLGLQEFTLRAELLREPDNADGGFSLGPRTLLRSADLADSGLLAQGSMFDSKYRLRLAENIDLSALREESRSRFTDHGLRWRDRRNAAPSLSRFVENMGGFLVLVGLAGLAVGGIGISAAVRAWLSRKSATIATLKTLGASASLILRLFLLQLLVMAGLGILAGLLLGAGLPLLLAPLIEASLPFPADIGLSAKALGEAALYGLLITLIFTLLPLARAVASKANLLYRALEAPALPTKRAMALLAVLLTALLASQIWRSEMPGLAAATIAGIFAALGLLALSAKGLRALARRASAKCRAPLLRMALAAIGAAGSEALSVMLSLGLGLSVLAAMGQIDSNLRRAIALDLPERAPAFFFVDIQPDQLADFRAKMAAHPAVSRFESAPMLRGAITKINGRPARESAPGHWVLRGDRGISYAARLPEGTEISKGSFWPEGYSGPPQASFSRKEAEDLGLDLGDKITANILGREITAEITSLREVDFASGAMNFVMILNEAALAGAPHSNIATLYAPPEAEADILRQSAKTWPNVTAIAIREAVDQASEALSAIAKATAWAAAGTLLTGFAVLIGAAAAGQEARNQEAAILKTLGATRAKILTSFALRAALQGAAAGAIAACTGAAAGYAVCRFVMEVPYHFDAASAAAILLGGITATLLANLFYARAALRAKPAAILRARD